MCNLISWPASDVGNVMSGGSHAGYDGEQSDDTLHAGSEGRYTPQRGRPFRVFTNSPRKRDTSKF